MAYYWADKFKLENDTMLLSAVYDLPKNHKFILIGDSYANRDNSWMDRFCDSLQIPSKRVAKQKISGGGFCEVSPSQNWQNVMENTTTYDNGDPIVPEEVTDIIICGGYNDRSSSFADLNTAMGNFRASARVKFPNAVMYLGFIAWSCNSTVYESLRTARYNYHTLASHFGYRYLNGVEYAMHMGTDCFEDNLHPDVTGRVWLSRAIKEAYLTGSWYPTVMARPTPANIDANVSGPAAGDFEIYMSGDETVLRFNGYKFFNFATPVSANTWVDICELPNTPLFGAGLSDALFKPVVMNVRDTNGDTFPVVVQWRIVRGDTNADNALIKIRMTTMGTGSYDRLTVTGFELHFNSMDQK